MEPGCHNGVTDGRHDAPDVPTAEARSDFTMNGAPFDAPDPRWEAFAAREPHFAVLTTPKFLRAHLTADAEREFFETGAALVDYMFRVIQERLAPDFAPT
jgi:hypothetical protein